MRKVVPKGTSESRLVSRPVPFSVTQTVTFLRVTEKSWAWEQG